MLQCRIKLMDRNPSGNIVAVWVGAVLSLILLCAFFYLQSQYRGVLALPVQYLIAAFVPIVIGILVSGYVRSVKVGGYEVSLTDKLLARSKTIPDASVTSAAVVGVPTGGWQLGRVQEYERTHGFMLAHVYKPSSERGQIFDVSIFVVQHKKGTTTPPARKFDEIQKAEFFFGESWGNQVFEVRGEDGFFGARVHAWGTFLAMCRVTFKDADKKPVILFRYVDFSMAKAEV